MGNTVPFEIDLDVTTQHGDSVNVRVTITYPEGNGLYAIAALEELATNTHPLYREMANRKDASTLHALTAVGRVQAEVHNEDHTPNDSNTTIS